MSGPITRTTRAALTTSDIDAIGTAIRLGHPVTQLDILNLRIMRAAQLRAAHAERDFETESAAYVARHLTTGIRARDDEKKYLRRLHADVLETAAAARELEGALR